MKTRTCLPDRVLEAATGIHLALTETNFYVEECDDIKYNEFDVIEFIGIALLPNFFKTGECNIPDDDLSIFLRELIAFVITENLKSKGIIDSISNEHDVEIMFLTKAGKAVRQNLIEVKNAA